MSAVVGLDADHGAVEPLDQSTEVGIGVRALYGSRWDFAATADLDTGAARRAGAEAMMVARTLVDRRPTRAAPG